MKQFPRLLPTLNLLPDWWVRATSPLFAQYRVQQLEYESQVRSILSHTDDTGTESHPTVFHSLRDDTDLPLSEKSLSRLAFEAQSLVGGGTLTSTHMLCITTYHILTNPPILSKLLEDLEEAIPDIAIPCPLQTLEQLPYLSAVVSEGLRVSYGSVHRLQRVYPENTLIFRDWTIPPGTPVSMSSIFMNDDASILTTQVSFRSREISTPSAGWGQREIYGRSFFSILAGGPDNA